MELLFEFNVKVFLLMLPCLLIGCMSETTQFREQNSVLRIQQHQLAHEADLTNARLREVIAAWHASCPTEQTKRHPFGPIHFSAAPLDMSSNRDYRFKR